MCGEGLGASVSPCVVEDFAALAAFTAFVALAVLAFALAGQLLIQLRALRSAVANVAAVVAVTREGRAKLEVFSSSALLDAAEPSQSPAWA